MRKSTRVVKPVDRFDPYSFFSAAYIRSLQRREEASHQRYLARRRAQRNGPQATGRITKKQPKNPATKAKGKKKQVNKKAAKRSPGDEVDGQNGDQENSLIPEADGENETEVATSSLIPGDDDDGGDEDVEISSSLFSNIGENEDYGVHSSLSPGYDDDESGAEEVPNSLPPGDADGVSGYEEPPSALDDDDGEDPYERESMNYVDEISLVDFNDAASAELDFSLIDSDL